MFSGCLLNALGKAGSPNLNILSDNIYVGLITSSYSPSQDSDTMWTTPVANEVSGAGYTANGFLLANKTLAVSSAVMTFTNTVNPSWAASTITARYAVFYDRTPATDATRGLIGWVNFGADVISSAGTFTITISGSGIFTVTCS